MNQRVIILQSKLRSIRSDIIQCNNLITKKRMEKDKHYILELKDLHSQKQIALDKYITLTKQLFNLTHSKNPWK